MAEWRFLIGDGEKHEIYISYSYWTGRLKVEIDGKQVASFLH